MKVITAKQAKERTDNVCRERAARRMEELDPLIRHFADQGATSMTVTAKETDDYFLEQGMKDFGFAFSVIHGLTPAILIDWANPSK